MRTRIVLVGAGGHARVIIDMLKADPTIELVGCVSANLADPAVLGVPILGGDEILHALIRNELKSAFVAVGDNRNRVRLLRNLKELGFTTINAISRDATVSSGVQIGAGVAIMPGSVVNVGTVIGDGVIVNTGAIVDHDCRIGAGAHIAPGARIAGRVIVGEGAFLGTGCSVIPGISIGSWTTVGAGAAVVRNLPEGVVAFGVPARVQKQLDVLLKK